MTQWQSKWSPQHAAPLMAPSPLAPAADLVTIQHESAAGLGHCGTDHCIHKYRYVFYWYKSRCRWIHLVYLLSRYSIVHSQCSHAHAINHKRLHFRRSFSKETGQWISTHIVPIWWSVCPSQPPASAQAQTRQQWTLPTPGIWKLRGGRLQSAAAAALHHRSCGAVVLRRGAVVQQHCACSGQPS